MEIASKEEIAKLLSTPSTTTTSYILDVRSSDEIADSGKFQVTGYHWVHIPVMPGKTEQLEDSSKDVFPQKDSTIVVYCKSGNRARFAKLALEGQGYTNVWNAGGYDDVITINL